MNQYQIALVVGAVLVSLATLHSSPRAVLWVALGAMSFAASTLIWRYFGTGDTWPAFFAGLLDAAVAVSIIAFHKRQWERYLIYIFQGMILVNFAYLVRLIGPHSAYVIALEILNWAALALIGGKTIIGWISNALGARGHPMGYLNRIVRALEKEKQTIGFIHRAK